MSGCPPDLALERYRLGEIAGTASAVWVAHIEACPKCQAALAELARHDAAFDAPPPAAEPPPRRRARARLLGPALALAAGVVAVIFAREPGSDFTPKGDGVLALTRVDGRAWAGEPLTAGTHVQLVWTAPRPGHLGVLGLERDGRATVLHPASGGRTTELGPARGGLLGGSILVDPSLDGARICAFFGDAPLVLDDGEAARRCGAGEATSILELRVQK